MNIKKLMTLLQKDEGTKLDYKLFLDLNSESGKKEFAKDVCAIANSKGGRGYLIVGVKDKTKEIVGLDDDKIFAEERVQQIISSRCEPPIPIQVDILKYNNKKIEVITVFDGYQKPYQIRETGAFHIRRGSTTDVMRKYEVLKAFEENLDLSIETDDIKLIERAYYFKGSILQRQSRFREAEMYMNLSMDSLFKFNFFSSFSTNSPSILLPVLVIIVSKSITPTIGTYAFTALTFCWTVLFDLIIESRAFFSVDDIEL